MRRIVGTLIGQIEDARLDAARRKRPDDLAAYDLWLRGWSALKRPDLAAIGEARRLFQQAVATDPHFARAYVGLAMAHLNEWACFSWNHWVFPKQEVLDLARKAVELDDRDHRAQCILGMAQLYAHDYEAARGGCSQALELNPNDADVLAHVSVGMALIGEHALAVEAGRRAHCAWHPIARNGTPRLSARRCSPHACTRRRSRPWRLRRRRLCNTPAFIAAAYAHLGQPELCVAHRDTVYRHHRRQQSRGLFPKACAASIGFSRWTPFSDPRIPSTMSRACARRASSESALRLRAEGLASLVAELRQQPMSAKAA